MDDATNGGQGDDSRVTLLFDEYRTARDENEALDVEALLERAGEARTELSERIQVFDDLHALSSELDSEDAELPSKLGRFEIQRQLGAGGLGKVYLARDPDLDRTLALKVLDRNLVPDRRERAWVLNEARSLAVLEHEGVVRVIEVGHADGFDYVATEHLTGPTLAEVVLELRRLRLEAGGLDEAPPSEARRLARSLQGYRGRVRCLHQIASALAYCHNRGVIHRDVKPENVVFDGAGVPKLIDFGLAHIEGAEEESQTRITTQLVGSAAYIAPEQVESNQTGADPRSDQFSLCTLFYETLALENPFEGATARQTTASVLRCEVPNLGRRSADVPAELATIVHHGLEREPDDRYDSVQALADDLLAWLEHRPLSVAAPSMAKRAQLWLRRNKRGVAVASAGVFLLIAALMTLWASGVADARRAILDELASVQLSALRSPEDFISSGLVLHGARANAVGFDRGLARTWFGEAVAPQANARIAAWSQALADAFSGSKLPAPGEAGPTEAPVGSEPVQRGEAFFPGLSATQDSGWRFAFFFEQEVCPDCPYNVEERERGTVKLPGEDALAGMRWEIQQMSPPPDPDGGVRVVFEPLARIPNQFPQGSYRLIAALPGADKLEYETHFVVSQLWPPARRIELRARDRTVFDRTMAIPAATAERMLGGPAPVERFRITRDCVTLGEFNRFMRSPEYEQYLTERGPEVVQVRSKSGTDDPVWVDIDAATAYCRWVGGRLPSFEELVVAQEGAWIPTHVEWVCNVSWIQNTWSGMHFDTSDIPGSNGLAIGFNQLRRALPRKDDRSPVFRIAFGDDHPDAYFD